MDADKLTTRSQEAFSTAVRRAAAAGHSQVEPVHLLLALLDAARGHRRPAAGRRGRGPARSSPRRPEAAFDRLPKASGSTVANPAVSRADLRRAADRAATPPPSTGDEFVSTEHLLVGLATGPSDVAELLTKHQITPQKLLDAFAEVRGSARVTSQDPESTYKALEKYGVDLTAAAREGKLDPVIGRDSEIRRVVQVLSRRTKNNPVLIGEPGVGKTAVVEGLAQRIVAGRRPGIPARQAIDRRSTWPPWSPGPSTAASSRSGSRPS